MKRTERQIIVDHFVDRGFAFNDPIDLAFYLAEDLQTKEPKFPSEYAKKILNAGYKSTVARELTEEIKQAVEATKKKEEVKK